MKNLIVINDQEVNFEVVDGEVFTTSLDIAAVFEKRHADIISKIAELPADDFNERNFSLVKYQDQKGEFRPMYKIARDGFSLLVMGFTGEKAYKWKIEFINAFNKMEAIIKNGGITNDKFTQVLTALSEKSTEADRFRQKYYESLELTNKLLLEKLQGNTNYNKRLSDSEKAEILRLYKNGFLLTEICKKMKRSDAAVRSVIRSAL